MHLPVKKTSVLYPAFLAFIIGFLVSAVGPRIVKATDYLFGSDDTNNFVIRARSTSGDTPTPVFQMTNTGAISNANINASQISAGTFGSGIGNGNFTLPANLVINGNIGIATTVPGYKLDIVGTLNASSAITQAGSALLSATGTLTGLVQSATAGNSYFSGSGSNFGIGTTVPGAKIDIKGAGTTNGLALRSVDSGGTVRFLVQDGGNVGIATTAPAAKLDVGGTTSTLSNSAGNITFTPAGSVIFSQGNIGIGTTVPAALLTVNGGFAIPSSTTVTITADNTLVTVGNRSYIRMTSNAADSTTRTFCLTTGVNLGQILVLEATDNGTNEIELNDGAESCSDTVLTQLSALWPPATNQNNDTLVLIWNGTAWLEIDRTAN